MRILSLSANNFMRLHAVEITPDGNVITLAGKNAAGKSSVLHGIFAALAGGKAVPGVPIHQGEDKATVRLDLGETGGPVDLKIERRFWGDDKTDVIITQASGARVQKPQLMLDGLINRISFDPLNGFMRLKPEDQLEMLRKLVKLDVDIDALAGQNQTDFETRTEVNREYRSLQARADAIVLPADCPTEMRDRAALLEKLVKASEHNTDVAAQRHLRSIATSYIASAHDKIEALRIELIEKKQTLERSTERTLMDIDAQILALKERRGRVVAHAASDAAKLTTDCESAERLIQDEADRYKAQIAAAPPVPELIELETVRAEITSADDNNALVTRRKEKEGLEAYAALKKVESDRLTAAIAERDQQREDAMKNADFPIDGLAFGDNMVMFQGLPLQQASTAEQIRIAMAIATDLNPKLRIVCIREASFLDEEGLKIVAEMAAASDMQVWLEDNRSTDPAAIVIEDGMVKGQVIEKANPPMGAMEPPREDGKSDMGRTAGEILADKVKPAERQAPTKLL